MRILRAFFSRPTKKHLRWFALIRISSFHPFLSVVRKQREKCALVYRGAFVSQEGRSIANFPPARGPDRLVVLMGPARLTSSGAKTAYAMTKMTRILSAIEQ